MAITTTRLNRLTILVTMGEDLKPKNADERKYVDAIREEIAEHKSKGRSSSLTI
jgi:hypothetical protein